MQANLVNILEVGSMLMYKLENHDNVHNWNVDFEELHVFFFSIYIEAFLETGAKTK